jgi:hypothetical protein
MKVEKIFLAASICLLLASCDGFVEVSGGPPSSYLVIFDQETFDTERAAWLKQNRQSYVFTLVYVGSSPAQEPTRIVVEAGTIAAYTALESGRKTTITDIYSDLAKAVQKKRTDYEAGKTAGARIVINYTPDHHPSYIYSAISSSAETGLIAGGSYREYIRDFGSVLKPDKDAKPGEYPIEFDGETFSTERTAWQDQGIDDYVFEIEGRDNKDMSKKIKCVVEDGVVTAAYWDYDEWDPMGPRLLEERQEHVFERLIGINPGHRPTTIPEIYAYLEKELELMRERYEKGIFSNLIPDSDETVAKIEVLYSSDGLHYPASIRFYAPIIWGYRHYYEMKISGFKAGVDTEDKQAWNEKYGDDAS